MTAQKEMGRGFNHQTKSAYRIYTIIKNMFELMFIKLTLTQPQSDEKF